MHLQGFQPADSALFNTLVTSLLKGLAHQASVSASHTVFMDLKRRQFYLSHLPAYFLEVNKRVMLSSPLVCSDSLFAESDISRLVADTPRLLSTPNRRWWMRFLGASVLVAGVSALHVLRREHPLLDVVGDRGHVPRPAR